MVSLKYNKFVIDDLLFVEYTCPVEDDVWGVWSQTDFIFHVLKGKKTFSTADQSWEIKAGETYYVRKGSFWMTQHLEEDFCMYGFFIPDDFIRETVIEVQNDIKPATDATLDDFNIKKIKSSPLLSGFFHSVTPFFTQFERPSNALLRAKLKELLIHLLTSGSTRVISAYLSSVNNSAGPSVRYIMENNFYFNLSVEQYAELCHLSVSSFKRSFRLEFNTTPGKWLIGKRLDYASSLLGELNLNIGQVAYRSGFINSSHFSRVFGKTFGLTPREFRSRKIADQKSRRRGL